jgi:transposase
MEVTKPRSRRLYPAELKQRAVGMVEEIVAREGNRHGVLVRVGGQLGIHPELLRKWVRGARQAGPPPTAPSAEQQRVVVLESEIRALRRVNEILKAACAVFAGEVEPRLPRLRAAQRGDQLQPPPGRLR